jgi:hypothetical protein
LYAGAGIRFDSALVLQSGHYDELKEALGAGLPAILAAVGFSLLLVVLAVLPPSALPVPVLADFLAGRRRQIALAAASICLSAAIALGIVFWVL